MTESEKALLIVDVQNDFCPGGALAVPNGDQVVDPLNKLISYASKNNWGLIVASRDWHPANTNHFKDFGGIWPVHCVQNTHGADFHPALKLTGTTYVFSKGMLPTEDAYSPFEGSAYERPLDEILRAFKIKKIYVGGLATDYCVQAACLDGKRLGYITFLLLDACRAVNINPDDEVGALEKMNDAGVVITTTEMVLNENR